MTTSYGTGQLIVDALSVEEAGTSSWDSEAVLQATAALVCFKL